MSVPWEQCTFQAPKTFVFLFSLPFQTLVNLLGARDTNVLLGTLLALASLAER